jgi:PilZ domain
MASGGTLNGVPHRCLSGRDRVQRILCGHRVSAAIDPQRRYGASRTTLRVVYNRTLISPKARQVMTDDSESVALRPTVIDGQRQEDDYEVIWRGLPIGRIMKPPSEPHWWWGCNVYGKPPAANDRGPGINFKDCQLRFKIAWTRIRAALTEEDISIAARHAEKLAEQQSSNVGEQPKTGELRNLENNRAALRQRVFKAGTIEFSGSTIDCVVRNISETGAALEVASPVGIPAEFNLLISGNIAKRPCRVVWVRDKRIGVAFRPA